VAKGARRDARFQDQSTCISRVRSSRNDNTSCQVQSSAAQGVACYLSSRLFQNGPRGTRPAGSTSIRPSPFDCFATQDGYSLRIPMKFISFCVCSCHCRRGGCTMQQQTRCSCQFCWAGYSSCCLSVSRLTHHNVPSLMSDELVTNPCTKSVVCRLNLYFSLICGTLVF
jgi:hypothetical protein